MLSAAPPVLKASQCAMQCTDSVPGFTFLTLCTTPDLCPVITAAPSVATPHNFDRSTPLLDNSSHNASNMC
ncbi:hypothetical protein DPMN_014050 [Dreissena polymorpha]|uniref:Uncharacterized protein n=1 Tax=Dreissena polymorpha TaxID=45954 RepID=A0A9D4N5A9_DREPO|nr:hypothetical protein DPMN_014050 [Dreissena polymorpha]